MSWCVDITIVTMVTFVTRYDVTMVTSPIEGKLASN